MQSGTHMQCSCNKADRIKRGTNRENALGRDRRTRRFESIKAVQSCRNTHRTARIRRQCCITQPKPNTRHRTGGRPTRNAQCIKNILGRSKVRIEPQPGEGQLTHVGTATCKSPGSLQRRNHLASSQAGARLRRNEEPALVTMPNSSNRSLRETATPCRGSVPYASFCR